ncbi:MAG: queuosine precursor transporter [Muribaculaceae bacterium]|nr:queuosine precursor transporter [Muribaculaceae bacterium]MDE6360947.1 queuosine precursor transporter [Muribaculaceae bacterium]
MDKTQPSKPLFTLPFLTLTVLFVVCLIIANLVEIKTVSLGAVTVTAGLAVFPLSYIINDCIVEVYGFRRARLAIWLGFAMSLLTAVMLNIAIWLPGGDEWQSQEAMEAIYGSVPRIMLASFAAFICGSMVNAYVMSRMKRTAATATSGATWRFSLRAIVSTLWGEGVDSLIFFPVAFGGILPTSTIISLIISQALLKTLYEILVLPVTVAVVKRLKRIEGEDTTDSASTDYSWWRLTDI